MFGGMEIGIEFEDLRRKNLRSLVSINEVPSLHSLRARISKLFRVRN